MAALLANPLFKWVLSWLASKLWTLASDTLKDQWAKQEARRKLDDHIRQQLERYEEAVKYGQELAKDGLTDAEKQAIRKRKIEIERDLIARLPR